jgi:hypothetical protein
MADPVIKRIERFACRRGRLRAERRNRGGRLSHATSGAPGARSQPTERDDRVEVLCWSLWTARRTSAGPFERTVLPRDDALQFIASEDIFWAIRP